MSYLKFLITRFRGDEFTKNTAILTLGTAFALGLNILAMPILSRLYTPADFGLLSIFVAISSIVATSITFRYETAILLPKSDQEAQSIMGLSVLLVFLGVIFFTLMTYLMPLSVKKYFGIEILQNWAIFAILCGGATSLVAIGTYWYIRKTSYKQVAKVRIVQSSLSVFVALLFGMWGFSSGMIIAHLMALSFTAFYITWFLKSEYPKTNNYCFVEVSRKYGATPKYLLPTSLLDIATLHLPIFLITAWFSTEAAGQYSMAWKIVGLPSALIGGAIGQVFYQKFAVMWSNNEACTNFLYKTWILLAALGFFPMLIILLFGEEIFSLLLGVAWAESGAIASVIAPMMYLMFISSPTSCIYNVIGLQKLGLLFGISFIFYRIGCIYLGVHFNNLFYGLFAWVVCEFLAIIIFNMLALKRMKSI